MHGDGMMSSGVKMVFKWYWYDVVIGIGTDIHLWCSNGVQMHHGV